MQPITRFTFLAFQINSLLDLGHYGELSASDVKDGIYRRTIFTDLKERYGQDFDISLYKENELSEILSQWEDLAAAVSEGRKFGVENDGLCLLLAYCIESIQRLSRQ